MVAKVFTLVSSNIASYRRLLADNTFETININKVMMYQPSINFNKIQNILIVKLRHHGDVLLTSPVFQVLKTRFPHVNIDALIYEETRPMLSDHPSIRSIYGIDRKKNKNGKFSAFKTEIALIKRLRQNKYNLVIHLTESWRGTLLVRLLKPDYSVVRKYQSRTSNFWINSFTHHYNSPVGNKRHTVEMHLDALRRLGVHPNEDERHLVLELNENAKRTLNKKLNNKLGDDYIVIHPTSRWLFKCWDVEKMAAVVNNLSEKGHTVVLTAAPVKNELQMINDILAMVNHTVVNLAGQLTLQELSVLISKSKLYFGLDSVPMHMASALRIPVVALFGPSGDIEWGPWKTKSHIITSSEHPCRPCGQDGCGNSKVSDCIQKVNVEHVCHIINLCL